LRLFDESVSVWRIWKHDVKFESSLINPTRPKYIMALILERNVPVVLDSGSDINSMSEKYLDGSLQIKCEIELMETTLALN
jgi:hypothetical protein